MEEERKDEQLPEEETLSEEQPVYVPRPKWQVIGAWIALVLFLFVIASFYINMFRGG